MLNPVKINLAGFFIFLKLRKEITYKPSNTQYIENIENP